MSNIPRLLLINLGSHAQGWSETQGTHVHERVHVHKSTLFPSSITINEKKYSDQIQHQKQKKTLWLSNVKRAQQLCHCQSWLGLIQSSATAQGQHDLLHSHIHGPQHDELDLLADPTENQLWDQTKRKKPTPHTHTKPKIPNTHTHTPKVPPPTTHTMNKNRQNLSSKAGSIHCMFIQTLELTPGTVGVNHCCSLPFNKKAS